MSESSRAVVRDNEAAELPTGDSIEPAGANKDAKMEANDLDNEAPLVEERDFKRKQVSMD